MALVDLKTDLKSLKFESGLNRKPFVVKDIDQEGGRNSGLAVQGILAAKRVDDVIRMAKLVIAKPGITHAAKQGLTALITAADKKAEYGGAGVAKELLDDAKDILATAVTNVAQTPLNGLGVHLYKGILNLDKDARDYVGNFANDARGPIMSPAHSLGISQGIKKSKKLTLAAKPEYGRIDYMAKPTGPLDNKDGVNARGIDNIQPDANSDIIPFYFGILNGEEDINYIQFRAYLDSLSDSYSGMWNKTQFLGRPEQFKTYNGFERSINFSFKIAAETRGDLKPLYRKLNYLASTTAPSFSKDGLFMRGTLVKINIGDYLSEQLCNISNISMTWQQDYPWEVKLQNKETDVQILPHVLDVSVTAEAIHEFIPQVGGLPYITNTKKDPIFAKPELKIDEFDPNSVEYIEEEIDLDVTD